MKGGALGQEDGSDESAKRPDQAEKKKPLFEGLWIVADEGSLSNGGPNGNRTRVSGVRGQRPRPLDDGTLCKERDERRVARDEVTRPGPAVRPCRWSLVTELYWLGEEDSNPRKQVQSLSSYHWTIPQCKQS